MPTDPTLQDRIQGINVLGDHIWTFEPKNVSPSLTLRTHQLDAMVVAFFDDARESRRRSCDRNLKHAPIMTSGPD